MKSFFLASGFLLLSSFVSAQDSTAARQLDIAYPLAFAKLDTLIQKNEAGSFKQAVFTVENTFLGNSLDYDAFQTKIRQMALLVQAWTQANRMKDYRFADSTNLKLNQGIYTLMKDSIVFVSKDGAPPLTTIPFTYDFDDFAGKQDYTKMFVSKLLYTYSGNCHSLPYLYKMLADELGASCWLSFAPNHIYIKNRCKKIGWYNTELTSGEFPIDAWITTSGYIPIKAIQSGIYMDTLSNRQALALCLLDLAKGYAFQTHNYQDGFILKCCDLVLQHHSMNAQALLLKAETLKRLYEYQKKDSSTLAAASYQEMEKTYVHLFDLGYREMPDKMYLQWLLSVNEQKEKYSNKQVREALQEKSKK